MVQATREGMAGYSAASLRHDLLAGATVAIVGLPQSIAYAMIAGVDPVYGLYTSVVSAIVGSLAGSSRHLVTGPTNAIALMVAGVMKDRAGSPEAGALLVTLTFLVGAVQLAFSLLRVGRLIHFVSHSVIVGFTAGAGVIIGLGQLNEFLGIRLAPGYHPLYEKVALTFAGLGSANPASLALAVGTLLVILVCRRINRNIPAALLALVAGGVAVAWFDLGARGVKLVGEIPGGLPGLAWPVFRWTAVRDLFGPAVAIAAIGLVEAIAISKAIAMKSEQIIQPGREFMGQGLANLAGSLFHCMPASGSFTRSAVNYAAQARTRLAGVLAGILVAITILFFAPYARHIPRAGLAAVIILVAIGMVDTAAIRRIARTNRHDRWVMIITLAATVVMPDLEKAVLAGVAVSIFAHLWSTGEIRIRILKPSGEHGFQELDFDQLRPGAFAAGEVPILHIEGDLYFGAAGDLEDKLRLAADRLPAGPFVLRLKRVNAVDVSAFEVLDNFIRKALERGRPVILCGVSPTLRVLLDRTGIAARVGPDNIFCSEDRLFASVARALARARSLQG
jgi:SulP family sulfate permease